MSPTRGTVCILILVNKDARQIIFVSKNASSVDGWNISFMDNTVPVRHPRDPELRVRRIQGARPQLVLPGGERELQLLRQRRLSEVRAPHGLVVVR